MSTELEIKDKDGKTDPKELEKIFDENINIDSKTLITLKDDLKRFMNLKPKLQTTVGPNITIDVQPDFRYILQTINYHSVKIWSQFRHLNIPLLTPPMITAYSLYIIHMFAAHVDTTNVRLNSSIFGNEYNNDFQRIQFKTLSTWLHIPPFIEEILRGLMPTFDPRRKNIAYLFNYACFDFELDFGRTFPINMFTKMHDIIANSDDYTGLPEMILDWLDFNVIEGTHNVKVANLLGAFIDGTILKSELYKSMTSLFAPVKTLSRTERPKYEETPTLSVPSPATLNDINPYTYLTGADDNNIHNTKEIMHKFSIIINQLFQKTNRLGDLFANPSGASLMNHFYLEPQLPTWHLKSTIRGSKNITPSDYAKKIGFMFDLDFSGQTKLKYPKHSTELEYWAYMVSKPILGADLRSPTQDKNKDPTTTKFFIATKKAADPDKAQIYSNDNYLPNVVYFDTWNSGRPAMAITAMTGINIESGEIDGFSIPQPNTANTIDTENSFVLNSAIPFVNCHKLSDISTTEPLRLVRRRTSQRDEARGSINLKDLSEHRLPNFSNMIEDAAKPTAMPGFQTLENIAEFKRGSDKWNFALTREGSSYSNTQPAKNIWLWSSYRWFNTNASATVDQRERKYFIANFRTLYGTNVPFYKSEHPMRLIPIL